MPIQRNSPLSEIEDFDYQYTPIDQQQTSTTMKNKNLPQQTPTMDNHPTDHIDQIRKVVREQTKLQLKCANVIRHCNSDSDSDDIEVPIRKFTPLPGIPRTDDVYFRTESSLIKHRHRSEYKESTSEPKLYTKSLMSFENIRTTPASRINNNSILDTYPIIVHADSSLGIHLQQKLNKKENTRYHFASSSKRITHRLPALEKQIHHSLNNAMDLDEDLPMNPVSEHNVLNQRQVYTSPGDRIISPVKRPQAPSPAASLFYREDKRDSDDSDNDEMFLQA